LFPHAPVSSPDKTKASAPVFVEFTVTRAAQQAYRTAKAAGAPPPTLPPKQKRARTSYEGAAGASY
jgi:hypothetical protein